MPNLSRLSAGWVGGREEEKNVRNTKCESLAISSRLNDFPRKEDFPQIHKVPPLRSRDADRPWLSQASNLRGLPFSNCVGTYLKVPQVAF